MNELALFAGAGGGILGGHLTGWQTVCAVEIDRYAASVLCARQNDGLLPPFPIWDDVRTFDGKPWRGIVDVVSGGFPCQDISAAGRGVGIDGERSGLWREMARIIGEVRPRFAFVENSPMLTSRGLGNVLGDLAALGYDAEWGVLGASDVGAPHIRKRIWILAYTLPSREWGDERKGEIERDDVAHASRDIGTWSGGTWTGWQRFTDRGESQDVPDDDGAQCEGNRRTFAVEEGFHSIGGHDWWKTEPDVGRVVDGMAARVDRLKSIGNGQVPAVAATIFRILNKRIKNERHAM